MDEAGVDISNHRSKHMDELKDIQFDIVITVCDNAHETCPYFPYQSKVIHVGFDDPPAMAQKIAKQGGTKQEQLDCFRQVRDEIKIFIQGLPDNIKF